ncbi:helix-turn-helix domain-containing protein [Sinomicrobium sp. M5D2P17]
MTRENLYEAYSIVYKTMDECPEQGHKHSFFELVYIVSGSGQQCINNNHFDYNEGHMFLITPEDCHSFRIETTTIFFFLRFNNIYIKDSGIPEGYIQKLEYILQNANHRPGCILKNLEDKQIVRPLVEAITREHTNLDISHRELIQQYVNTLILIVVRNIAKFQGLEMSAHTEDKAHNILQFIQSNIFYPEKLRTDFLSEHFNLSNAYLGRYFKKHTGQTMRDYIAQYRTKLIEHRLQHSDKRINEIAGEFGFTDESHFNKFFRKQNGQSPRSYRKKAGLKA